MRTDLTTAIVWMTRLAWIGLAVVAPESIGRWIESVDPSRLAGATLWSVAGAVWLVGVIALAFPSVVSLTVARTVMPLAAVAMIWLAVRSVDPWSVVSAGLAVADALGVSSAEFGRRYVQASAYGDEERFVLRPPPVYLALCVVAWLFAAATTLAALWSLADRTAAAVAIASVSVAIWWWGWRRWHRLARRWAVAVPAGLVLHDHLVLAETVMVPRAALVAISPADDDTAAFDLTGGATGGRVEFATREPVTVLLAASPDRPTGTAIHLSAATIALSRPGSFLRWMRQTNAVRAV